MKSILAKILVCITFLAFDCAFAQGKDKIGASANQEAMKEELIEVVKSEQFLYCALEMKGSYGQHQTAFNTLYQEISSQGLSLQDFPAGIYWNNPRNTPVEELNWELGIYANSELDVKAPLKMKKWNYLLAVRKSYEGAFETENESNLINQLYTWIERNGYLPEGPLVRKFLSIPVKNELGQWAGKSEIIIPVKKKEN